MSTNGWPAFQGQKQTRFGQDNDCNEGMTLRDYFAAKAMQGDMAREEWSKDKFEDYASWAYLAADAMIAARETK